jgi:hypothetical protein
MRARRRGLCLRQGCGFGGTGEWTYAVRSWGEVQRGRMLREWGWQMMLLRVGTGRGELASDLPQTQPGIVLERLALDCRRTRHV